MQDRSPPARRSLLRRTAGPYIGVNHAAFTTAASRALFPRLPTWERTSICDAVGHVWTAPGWQELSSRMQQRSEQPCVRPLDAVHMTAGHNALRGSGPGQKHAFDDAVAQVGCPDRRIDRLCITCCSPSQPSHHVGCPTRSRLRDLSEPASPKAESPTRTFDAT